MECPFCAACHSTGVSLFRHVNSNHLKEVETKLKKSGFENDNSLPDDCSRVKDSGGCNKLKCHHCQMLFANVAEFTCHANLAHADAISQRWSKCFECDLLLINSQAKAAHHQVFHSSEETKCRICLASFKSLRAFVIHANKVHQSQLSLLVDDKWEFCPQCDLFFPPDQKCPEHKPVQKFKCDSCSAQLQSQKELQKHFAEVHKSDLTKVWIYCDECDHYLPSSKTLKEHKMESHQRAQTRRGRPVHINPKENQTLDASIKCPRCSINFPNEASLESHLKWYHFNWQKCLFCDWTTKQRKPRSNLQHVNEDHLDQIVDAWSQCPHCQFFLPDFFFLEKHVNFYHRRHYNKLCPFCDSSFVSASSFNKHVASDHRLELSKYWLECHNCNIFLPDLVELTRHRKDVHNLRKNRSKANSEFENSHHPEKLKKGDTKNQSKLESNCQPTKDRIQAKRRKYENTTKVEGVNGEENEATTFCPNPIDKISKVKEAKSESPKLENNKLENSKVENNKLENSKVENNKLENNKPDEDFSFDDEASNEISENGVDVKKASLKKRRRTENVEMSNGDKDKETFQVKTNNYFKNDLKRPIKCLYCELELSNRLDFYQHANQLHLELISGSWIPCEQCGEFYPSQRCLNGHQSKNHKEKSTKPKLKIICKICDESYSSYYLHMQKSHSEVVEKSWHKCGQCPQAFPTSIALKRHRSLRHLVGKKLCVDCTFCSLQFVSRQKQIIHANRFHKKEVENHWIKCHPCSKFFPQGEIFLKHNLLAHMTVKKTEGEKIACQFCSKMLSTQASFYKHTNDFHLSEISSDVGNWLKCPHCPFYLPDQGVLDNHVNHGHTEKRMKKGYTKDNRNCLFCNKLFTKAWDMYIHVVAAHKEQAQKTWYHCEQCLIYLPTKLALTFHNKRGRHFLNGVQEKPKCHFCNDEFSSQNKVYSHANKKHLDHVQIKWKQCQSCQKYLPDEAKVSLHAMVAHQAAAVSRKKVQVSPVKSMSRLTRCRFCQKMLASPEEYYRHATVAHQAEVTTSWHLCDKCQLYLPTKTSFRSHHKVEHSVSKEEDMNEDSGNADPIYETEVIAFEEVVVCSTIDQDTEIYFCSICNQTFFQQTEFIQHSNEIHSAIISPIWHLCSRCQLYLPDETTFKEHQAKQHKNKSVMRIGCTECSKVFTKPSDFYWHANQNHRSVVEEDWFLCTTCNFYFPEWENLEQHKLYFHTNK